MEYTKKLITRADGSKYMQMTRKTQTRIVQTAIERAVKSFGKSS